MIGKIKYIANLQDSDPDVAALNYFDRDMSEGTFEEFVAWIDKQMSYQLDIETNVTDWWHDKTLISIQFGSCETGIDRVQWFLQWSELTVLQQTTVRLTLTRKWQKKLIHHARFEYIVLRFTIGVTIENIYDTFLAEKVINAGDEVEDYALADISWKYLRVIMNKDEQTQFGDNIITTSKIVYGITDVAYLDTIMRLQYDQILSRGLVNVIGLEMDALLAFSDATYNGMALNKEKWRENLQYVEPIIAQAKKDIDRWVTVEPFKSYAIQKGFYSLEDRVVINFNSHDQKRKLLTWIFPDLVGGTKVILKKYIRDNAMNLSFGHLNILQSTMEGDNEPLSKYCVENFKEALIVEGLLIPAGECTCNWNSATQVLPMGQLVEKRLKDLSKESIDKTSHPMFQDRKHYINSLKLSSTFGEEYIRKHVADDGMVRSTTNQVMSTGRVSSSDPNIQQVVVGDKISIPSDLNGLRYRNCFYWPDPDWVFVDSDYVSQELVIIAYLSKDPVWLDCIANDYDLHSVCSELVFKNKWKKAAKEDCAYYKMVIGPDGKMRQAKQKCKCKEHKILRDKIKPISFGLAYGMSEFKLAGTLRITVPEAAGLINEYFLAFPAIGALLEFLGNFGMTKGYIMTLDPFFRKRYFPYWEENKQYITPHILGVQNNKTLGSIDRASRNMPIQGASADITKTAMVLIRNYIHDHDMQNQIKIVAQVHDQITTVCHKDVAEWWRDKMDELMVQAGKVVIPSGILKADTNISLTWTK